MVTHVIFMHAIIRIRLCFSCRWGVTIILYIAYTPRIEHYIVCPASSHTQFVQFLYTINMFFHIYDFEFLPQKLSRAGKGTIMETLVRERYNTYPATQFIMSL